MILIIPFAGVMTVLQLVIENEDSNAKVQPIHTKGWAIDEDGNQQIHIWPWAVLENKYTNKNEEERYLLEYEICYIKFFD